MRYKLIIKKEKENLVLETEPKSFYMVMDADDHKKIKFFAAYHVNPDGFTFRWLTEVGITSDRLLSAISGEEVFIEEPAREEWLKYWF